MIAWAITVGLAGVALLAIGSNWAGMLGLLRPLRGTAARSFSPIPLIGGVLGAAALASAPVEMLNRWFWLPLLLDPGTGLYLLALAGSGIRHAWTARVAARSRATETLRASHAWRTPAFRIRACAKYARSFSPRRYAT